MRRKLKGIVTLIVVFACIFNTLVYADTASGGGITAPSNKSIDIRYNGIVLKINNAPEEKGGKLWVPACEMFKALGMDATLDPANNTVRAKNKARTVVVQADNGFCRINARLVKLAALPFYKNGDIMICSDDFDLTAGMKTNWDKPGNSADLAMVNDEAGSYDDNHYKAVAGEIAARLKMTEAELDKIKAQAGSWRYAALEIAADEAANDELMVKKLHAFIGAPEDYLLKAKYQLGDWPAVAYSYFGEREKKNETAEKGYYVETPKGGDRDDVVVSLKQKDATINPGAKKTFVYFKEIDIVNARLLAGLIDKPVYDIAVDGSFSGWSVVFEKYNAKFIEAAAIMGMPEEITAKLQKLNVPANTIYRVAEDAYTKNDNYKQIYRSIKDMKDFVQIDKYIRSNCTMPRSIVRDEAGLDNAVDGIDTVLVREYGITDKDIQEYSKYDIKRPVYIALSKVWKIDDGTQIANLLTLSRRHNTPIYKVYETAFNYINWNDIDSALNSLNGAQKNE